MIKPLPDSFVLSNQISQGRRLKVPIVALETAVLTHGLPSPQNLILAEEMETIVRKEGALPATIGLLNGKIRVGMTHSELKSLANEENARKISVRDFGIALANDTSGGTTVAATLFVASSVGIRVFATGGIGGIHRGMPFDISADLPQLGKSPVIVVCAGVKAILDLPGTLEALETLGVPVIGFQTDEFPAFYSPNSGLPVDVRIETPEEAVKIALQSWNTNLKTALLLVVPPPPETALDSDTMYETIEQALAEAERQGIHGAETTPYLLKRVSELTHGDSLQANLALLRNNARVAAQVAVALETSQQADSF